MATRPKELTRAALKELRLALNRNGFSETMLQTAWKQMTNEDIAADIISFIRQRSIGDALISKDKNICVIWPLSTGHKLGLAPANVKAVKFHSISFFYHSGYYYI